jgi:lipoprotein-anchoring transpeptidase ErfK/SrfK
MCTTICRKTGPVLGVFAFVLASLPAVSQAKEVVALESAKYPMGSIVIDTSERRLYYSLGNGQALKYKVAVGKPGYQWFGKTFIEKKKKDPGWSPTARMRRNGAPRYVPPGPRNPLGVRAIYLGWSEYRIHGTNAPSSIGRAASSGCIRMLNKDVSDLFERVHIGAPVYVIR